MEALFPRCELLGPSLGSGPADRAGDEQIARRMEHAGASPLSMADIGKLGCLVDTANVSACQPGTAVKDVLRWPMVCSVFEPRR